VDRGDAKRSSLPLNIALERRTNPFLRCHIIALAQMIAKHSGKQAQNKIDNFAQLCAWKDDF